MKEYFGNFIIVAIVFALSMFTLKSFFVALNWYPYGYPVHQGEYWKFEYVYNEGTPIEKRDIWPVRVDSVYEGYVIQASLPNGTIYTNGSTMYRFLGHAGLWGGHEATRISEQEFKAYLKEK